MFDARRTGWSIDDHLEDIENDGYSEVSEFIFYITYSGVYHTNPDCPYLKGSKSIHRASSHIHLPEIWCTGPQDQLDECSWCE